MASVTDMGSIRRTGRYLEATRVFGAVTAGRAARTAQAIVHEAEQVTGQLPSMASRMVARGIEVSATLLRGGGRAMRGVAERLETARRR